ncbi:MAG: LytTR family DNA-binding domain-containing protein [Acidobacteriota bacterium]|nr:LytTR family DNA-binding domain-containing protein [Acidobacteriota bacterium]
MEHHVATGHHLTLVFAEFAEYLVGKNIDPEQILPEAIALRAQATRSDYLHRLPGHLGDRVHILKTGDISIIGSEDGCSYAMSEGRKYYLRETLNRLEPNLDPDIFIRIHRGYLVNVDFIRVLDRWPGGKFLVTIEDVTRKKLATSRTGAERLRKVLGLARPARA